MINIRVQDEANNRVRWNDSIFFKVEDEGVEIQNGSIVEFIAETEDKGVVMNFEAMITDLKGSFYRAVTNLSNNIEFPDRRDFTKLEIIKEGNVGNK